MLAATSWAATGDRESAQRPGESPWRLPRHRRPAGPSSTCSCARTRDVAVRQQDGPARRRLARARAWARVTDVHRTAQFVELEPRHTALSIREPEAAQRGRQPHGSRVGTDLVAHPSRRHLAARHYGYPIECLADDRPEKNQSAKSGALEV